VYEVWGKASERKGVMEYFVMVGVCIFAVFGVILILLVSEGDNV